MRHQITFEHKIRSEWLYIEASGWADDDGLYKVRVDGAFMDGVNVIGLLTDDDVMDIESAIPDAFSAESDDRRVTGHIPGPYPSI